MLLYVVKFNGEKGIVQFIYTPGINWWTLTLKKLARSVRLKLYDVYLTVEFDAV